MRKICLLTSFMIISWSILCQSEGKETHNESVKTIVEAFNKHDYRLMQKPWGTIGKLIISKKRLRKEFFPVSEKLGDAKIDTVIFSSSYNATVELKFEKYPLQKVFLSINFSENGKVQGLGYGYPTMVYRKNNSPISDSWSNEVITQKIDSIFSKYATKSVKSFNGCILVTRGEDILFEGSNGYADFEKKTINNDSTRFLLASCSKQFTACAIMRLHEQGKLNYSDKVITYLPDFPYESITIEHLLTHTSGLPDYFVLLDKYWDKSTFATNNDVYDLLKEKKQALLFNPNDDFSYSNTGYVILSVLIEKISGSSYGEFLNDQFFKPLHMNQTVVYNRRKENNSLENYASGYVYSRELNKYVLPDSLKNYNFVSYMDGITGDDGVSSSIHDLKRWNEALRNTTVLSKESLEIATTKHKLTSGKEIEYGFGFFLKQGNGIENMIYHTGGWPGYTTLILRFQDRAESIIILSNNEYDNFSFLADEICSLLLR